MPPVETRCRGIASSSEDFNAPPAVFIPTVDYSGRRDSEFELKKPQSIQAETDSPETATTPASGSSDIVIPLIQEELELSKRQVRTGTVVVTKVVRERAETVSELIASEHVQVERIARDEIITAPPAVRTEGDVTFIPVIEEVVLVTRQLRLKEELKITRKRVLGEHREEVTLRTEELTVERRKFSKPE